MIEDSDYLNLASASRAAGGAPRLLSDLIYQGRLDVTGWPKVSGKVLVPRTELARLRKVVQACPKLRYRKRS
jgi:hypothetical protein